MLPDCSVCHLSPCSGGIRSRRGVGCVNNLKLNPAKSKEMIIRRLKTKLSDLPLPIAGIQRVDSMIILGVTLRPSMSMLADWLGSLLRQCMPRDYYRSQGLHGRYIWDVTGAVLVSRLTYISQAWWGLINEDEKNQLGAIIAKAVKQGFLAPMMMMMMMMIPPPKDVFRTTSSGIR